jgi:hypothetical protein
MVPKSSDPLELRVVRQELLGVVFPLSAHALDALTDLFGQKVAVLEPTFSRASLYVSPGAARPCPFKRDPTSSCIWA